MYKCEHGHSTTFLTQLYKYPHQIGDGDTVCREPWESCYYRHCVLALMSRLWICNDLTFYLVTSLYRDAVVRHAESTRHESRKPSKAHTHKNASLPTQANNTARAAKKTPPHHGAIHASNKCVLQSETCIEQRCHTHHTATSATKAPGTDKPARHPPRAQQVPVQRTNN